MTTEARAQALGDRAVALANASHNVIVTGDLVLGTERPNSDVLLLARALGELAPRCTRRLEPLTPPPAPHDDRLDREAPIDVLRVAVGSGRCASLFGDGGIGKSYVLRAAVEGMITRDGTVWIDGAQRPADDILQGVFEQLYDAYPIVATREQRRGLLGEIHALVIVDQPREVASDADQIRAELPGSAVVLATRDPAGWGGTAAQVELEGLAPEDALSIVARQLGKLDEEQRRTALELVSLLRGNPRRLQQACHVGRKARLSLPQLVRALTADPESELRLLLMQSLAPSDRRLVEALAGACGATLAMERLRELTGVEDAGDRLERLRAAGLIESGSPRYRLAGALAGLEVDGSRFRLARHLAEFGRGDGQAREAVGAELPAASRLVEWACDEGRDALAIALGQQFAPAAFHARRWGVWGQLLGWVELAARRNGDLASLSWALHQRGTRMYARGDATGGVEALQEALELRRRADDEDGATATRHNLDFILGPPGPPPDGGQPPAPRPGGRWIATAVAVVALVMAGGAALGLPFGSDEDERTRRAQTRVPDLRSAVSRVAQATVRRAGLKPVVRGRCRVADRCRVRRQSPEPGREIVRGGRVRLQVAETGRLVPVPSLRAKTRNQAAEALRAVDLSMLAAGSCLSKPPRIFESADCRVKDSLPVAGSRVPTGARIRVTFTGSPVDSRVTVPDLEGRRLRSIRKAVSTSGLTLATAGGCGAASEVVDAADCLAVGQDVAPGESVDRGSTVTVTFGAKATGVAVPNVEALTCKDATAALGRVQLETRGCVSDTDRVRSSQPTAGTMVAPGSSVALAVQSPDATPEPSPAG